MHTNVITGNAIVINRIPVSVLVLLALIVQPVFAQQFSDSERNLWSIQPIRRAIPDIPGTDEWGRNAIDQFILQRLNESDLKPAPPANPRTLVRRLFLDVTGVPPTPEQVESYISAARPKEYDALVEELLENRGYGER